MTEHEVLQRKAKWLSELNQIAGKYFYDVSFDDETETLRLWSDDRMIIVRGIALYPALMFVRGINACSMMREFRAEEGKQFCYSLSCYGE